MRNVKRLSIFFLSFDEDIEKVTWEDVNELVTFVQDRGFTPIYDPTGLEPTVVDFDLEEEISIDDALDLMKAIEYEGKYECSQFFFNTEKDDYYDRPPFARIYLLKIE